MCPQLSFCNEWIKSSRQILQISFIKIIKKGINLSFKQIFAPTAFSFIKKRLLYEKLKNGFFLVTKIKSGKSNLVRVKVSLSLTDCF
jgi:hypothetical protein